MLPIILYLDSIGLFRCSPLYYGRNTHETCAPSGDFNPSAPTHVVLRSTGEVKPLFWRFVITRKLRGQFSHKRESASRTPTTHPTKRKHQANQNTITANTTMLSIIFHTQVPPPRTKSNGDDYNHALHCFSDPCSLII
jgi:hypothetical protein